MCLFEESSGVSKCLPCLYFEAGDYNLKDEFLVKYKRKQTSSSVVAYFANVHVILYLLVDCF